MDYTYISNNYHALIEEIEKIAKSSHGQHVALVAVTKSGSDEELLALCEAGACDIGENRPQELKRRGDLIRQAGFDVRLHEIGNLQKNKVKLIADSVALIHSVDSLSLAEQISKHATAIGRKIPVLIEVNSAREPMKDGVMPEEAEQLFLDARELDGISVVGIMTMGPALDNPEDMRPYFRLTKEIFDSIKTKYGFVGDGILSMGMSDSYRVAIEEGSTLVRVGRKLFDKTKGDR
jgi:pyridoxal phosphate enzyme (YggS family)